MDVRSVTPVVLTYNEADNIQRVLSQLSWAGQVVVIDSHSTDGTDRMATGFPNVALYQRRFDNHTEQWNFGIAQVTTEWALTLDADYVCSEAFCQELASMDTRADVYFAEFEYCVFGRALPSSLYPPRAVLFRPAQCRYKPDGHTQLLEVSDGSTAFFSTKILHDDRKPLSRWCSSQLKYAELEADKLLSTADGDCGWKDRVRKRPLLAPPLVFFYCLFAKRMIVCGKAGLYYTAQRVYAEFLLSLVLLDRKLRAALIR